MKNLILVFIFLLLAIIQFPLNANNIQVSNVAITDLNPTDDYAMVYFDLSWDNSWRTSTITSNWDAAWVFVKYRKVNESNWNHAILNYADGTGSGDGHVLPLDCNIDSSDDTGTGGAHGVFIHRDADMTQGTVNYNGIKLRWNYGDNGLADNEQVEISVMAIEMVYIPQGSFYVGSGGHENETFYKYPTITNPYQITSEAAINVGTTSDYLYYNGGGDQTGPIPADFPKGYNAFYCMKYEITQDQYVAFLNKLSKSNAILRVSDMVFAKRCAISVSSDIYSTSLPYVACNYLSPADVAAYLDWAALRPMTELEFEKAARGPIVPVAQEYAWGTIDYTVPTTIDNTGLTNEKPSNAAANSTLNCEINTDGPMRVGCFGQGINTRTAVGAGYYGVMELSGNVSEMAVSVGSALGRTYTGIHGNGELFNGLADVVEWTFNSGSSTCLRGGAFSAWQTQARISDRPSVLSAALTKSKGTGGRGVRTAP